MQFFASNKLLKTASLTKGETSTKILQYLAKIVSQLMEAQVTGQEKRVLVK